MSAEAANPTLTWQTLPTDLLVLIVKPLVLLPRRSYIPLICAHVCQHWRQAVLNSPALWSYVDVSRGYAFTELWLLNSANAPIDVKLWQPPEDIHTIHSPPVRVYDAIEITKRHIERWRSLDISFWCESCMEETMAFLGQRGKDLELNSLTVGPMGKSVFLPKLDVVDGGSSDFGALKIEPTVLRVDSYCFAPDCSVFSTRLTTIEMFSVPDIGDGGPVFEYWRSILCSTPNLISLTLWHSIHLGTYFDTIPEETQPPVSLPSLKQLNLTSGYLEIMLILSHSPLPKLESLRIDSGSSRNIPLYIGRLATVAPCLSSLALSCPQRPSYRSTAWDKVFQKLQSLQHLTFFEMDKSVAKKILALENLPRSLASVRLQRTYGHDTIRWPPANAAIENPPTLSFVGYDNVVRTKSADGTCQVTCLDDYDKEIVEHEFMAESVYYSRESNIYVGEDLALIRGPNSEIADLSNYTSDDDNLEGEISSDSSDRESEDSSADTSDDSDSDISVRNSDSDDSLTSGDFYVLSQGQRDSSVDDMEEDEEDENVDASIESSMSSNLDVFL